MDFGVITMAQMMMERPPSGLFEGLEKISATQELGVEHAVLDRIMLAMDRTLKMASSGGKSDLSVVNRGCDMIGQVVDRHHMKVEEDMVYPKFENTKLADLASTLQSQHDEMRKMVARMGDLSKTGAVRDKSEMDQLLDTFKNFRRMVMAHAAWEETVMFPCVEGTWSRDELKRLKEQQEEHEKELLGKDASMKVYSMLADLEKSAGITGIEDLTRPAR